MIMGEHGADRRLLAIARPIADQIMSSDTNA
jgi:hypothetical protein